jgi:pyruvate ferredoxin oxidoreductase alpha subunit
VEQYRSADARYLIVTLGSIAGTVRAVVDEVRARGLPAGLIRLRYLRPFPTGELLTALFGPQRTAEVVALGVLEKDISFGHQGTVSLEVRAALYEHASGAGQGRVLPTAINFIAGLGGQDVSRTEIAALFTELAQHQDRPHPADSGVRFVGLKELVDDYC